MMLCSLDVSIGAGIWIIRKNVCTLQLYIINGRADKNVIRILGDKGVLFLQSAGIADIIGIKPRDIRCFGILQSYVQSSCNPFVILLDQTDPWIIKRANN